MTVGEADSVKANIQKLEVSSRFLDFSLVFYWRITTEYARVQKRNWYATARDQFDGESLINLERRKCKSD